MIWLLGHYRDILHPPAGGYSGRALEHARIDTPPTAGLTSEDG